MDLDIYVQHQRKARHLRALTLINGLGDVYIVSRIPQQINQIEMFRSLHTVMSRLPPFVLGNETQGRICRDLLNCILVPY